MVNFMAILVELSLGKGMLFGKFGLRTVKLGNFNKKTTLKKNFCPGNAKIW